MIDVKRTSWIKPHSLERNEVYAAQQIKLLQTFFRIGDDLHLCFQLYPMEYPGAGDDQYKHVFVTNCEGTWVVEFGEFGWGENDLIVSVHYNPRREYSVEDPFILTTAVMERMKKVVGTMSYSAALRNREHVSRYIQSGSWFSFQMSKLTRFLNQGESLSCCCYLPRSGLLAMIKVI